MRVSFKRTLGAALMLAVVPAAASAQSTQSSSDSGSYSAIATGLAIPVGPGAAQAPEAVPVRKGKYVIVDAAAARLYMMEDGRVRDSMRVVVGKPGASTPALTSVMRYATVNPYWNVPPNLTQANIAPNVLKEGVSWLDENGYEVVASFAPDAEVLPADSVDWKAVAAGRDTIFVRQLPGPGNAMGQIKFGLDTGQGIFLHDTNRKDLFAEDERFFSNGCVRLEDASRFARWLFGEFPAPNGDLPEQLVRLPAPVPVVITYDVAAHQMAGSLAPPNQALANQALADHALAGLQAAAAR